MPKSKNVAAQVWRVFIPGSYEVGDIIECDSETFHFLHRVLRKKTSDKVEVLNTQGLVAKAVITKATAREMSLEVIDCKRFPRAELQVTAIQAVISFDAMSWMVEKLTEMGVDHIHFYDADRGQHKLEEKKLEKLRRVSLQALRQCGNPYLPEIKIFTSLDAAMEHDLSAHYLYFDETSDRNFSSFFDHSLKGNLSYVIGPESSLSKEERTLLEEKNITAYRLIDNVLRAETACIAACATIRVGFYQKAP
ncbi:MAG: 16S rRNA (uracil(1498)-N(3))-methyltransferase [Bdellovibrionales bacterium]|nr:16S rRNA (uracil(1498)-N(3))-methyltransferase [Bdellovibrionales bacterium]